MIDVYDHEVDELIRVQHVLEQRAHDRMRNYGDFEREIKERFAEIGFVVDVNWFSYAVNGEVQAMSAMPEVSVVGRTDPSFVFDQDRQVHEVTSNLLGLSGDQGVIDTSGYDTSLTPQALLKAQNTLRQGE